GVYGNDCLRARRKTPFEIICGHAPSNRIDFGEDRLGSQVEGHVRRRHEGKTWNDNLVPRSYRQGEKGHVKGSRAIRRRHGVTATAIFCELMLKAVDELAA